MKRYGVKTRKIILLLIALAVLFVILSVIAFLLNLSYFQGFLLIAVISLFLVGLIYFVIYKQFLKIEEIAEEIER